MSASATAARVQAHSNGSTTPATGAATPPAAAALPPQVQQQLAFVSGVVDSSYSVAHSPSDLGRARFVLVGWSAMLADGIPPAPDVMIPTRRPRLSSRRERVGDCLRALVPPENLRLAELARGRSSCARLRMSVAVAPRPRNSV